MPTKNFPGIVTMTKTTFSSQPRSWRLELIRTYVLLLVCASVSLSAEPVKTNIKSDENVVFFRTDASYVEGAEEWLVPVHGWVYEDERSWFRKNAFSRILRAKYGLAVSEDNSIFFDRRTGLMIADNERNKVVVIEVGDERHTLPRSGPNGHFKGELRIAQQDIEQVADGDIVRYRALLPAADDREFTGAFRLIPTDGVSIISDIDDTVKITGVTSKRDLMDNTFYREFAAIPGMAERYQEWEDHGLEIHFLSSSPWQLYPELYEFTRAHDFPWASFYLKNVRFKDRTFLNLFKEGSVTKPIQIAHLLERFPARQFVLIGDSGEQDPEAYTMMMMQYPERIKGIFIRNVTGETLNDERFLELTDQLPDGAIQLFEDPKEIVLNIQNPSKGYE